MISLEQITSDLKHLPSLPVSFARVAALLNDDKCNLKAVEEALLPDPALTANILKLANSPLFGFRRQITSVRQAVTLVGNNKVLEAATTAALSGLLPPVLHGYNIDAEAFFRHSIAVAVIGEQIALTIGFASADQAYTCGLLHDIGKLVTSQYLARQSKEVTDAIRLDRGIFIDVENQVLGVDHAEVGRRMAELWNLPDVICHAIDCHHTPTAEKVDVADIVHVADCLAHAMGYGADIGELSRRIDSGALNRTALSPRQQEQIVGESVDRIEGLSAVFSTMTGGA